MIPKKVALLIVDGLGLNPEMDGNACAQAVLPTLNQWVGFYPAVSLAAAGQAVGLPEKSSGDSQLGHQMMGTGQVIAAPIVRTLAEVEAGTFWQNAGVAKAFAAAKAANTKIHLVGLLSDANTHACLELLYALIDAAKHHDYPNKLYLHIWLDGRDTQIHGGQALLEKLYIYLQNVGYGSIATVSGRFFPMDRDGNTERITKVLEAMTQGKGEVVKSPLEGLMDAYAHGHTDETLSPLICDVAGTIGEGDSVIFFNHRPDRVREIVEALDSLKLPDLTILTYRSYYEPFDLATMYDIPNVEVNLGQVLAKAGKSVTKITESDRYAHLTYFFNGGQEEPYDEEDRTFVPSPKDEKVTAEQSLKELEKEVATILAEAKTDLLIVNIPNVDACGHTGDLDLTVTALQKVDAVLANWLVAADDEWLFIVTSDHGNAEYMVDPQTKEPRSEDTANPVPCLLVHSSLKKEDGPTFSGLASKPPVGMLTDIPTTILAALDVKAPSEMTGVNLLDQI